MESRDSIAQARLAYITAGAAPAAGPRRAAPESLEEVLAAQDPVEDSAIEVPVEPPPASIPVWQRPQLTRRHVVALLIVLGVGVLVALGIMATSSATPVTLDVRTPEAGEVSVPEATTEPVPEPVQLPIHVLGAVHHPGVVTVPDGSIVQDAVRAAGGFTADADPAQLNLAAPLSAGQQIIVGTVHEPQGEVRDGEQAGERSQAAAPVNLNTATAQQLEELPGVGPVLAASIIQWRENNGGFTAVEDLQEVSGIGPRSFEKLAPLVTV